MNLRFFGYACINLSINRSTNGSFRLKNLSFEKYYECTKKNLNSLLEILKWNVDNNIYFFRIGSEIIPFASHKEFSFDWVSDFNEELKIIKDFIIDNNIRVTMHPGQYTVLNSPRDEVVSNSIKELEYHAKFLDNICADARIVIHTGGVYGDKKTAMDRFIKNFALLDNSVKNKIILENDDKSYRIEDVLYISNALNIPIVFDILHHVCNNSCIEPYLNLEKVIEIVVNSWNKDIPVFHLSSRKYNKGCPHTDYIIYEDFKKFYDLLSDIKIQKDYDIMIEAKAKDKALIDLREKLYKR